MPTLGALAGFADGNTLRNDAPAMLSLAGSWQALPRLQVMAGWNYYFDKDTRTIVHLTVKKIYDVSAVSIPANDNTEINARAWVDGEIAEAARRDAELDDRRRRLRLKIKLQEEVKNEN